MGGSVSCFKDNQSLVDSLMETCELPKDLERIMRLVDRGVYSTKPKDRIYSDSAWRSGNLHLSSPSIYCTVLREMELKPGISVLNIGSGTGFLSTMFGLVLGSNGVNHGIEVSASNFAFAKSRLAEFLTTSDAVYEFDFCPPQFVLGNIFSLVPSSPQTSCQTVSTETFATASSPDRLQTPNPFLSSPIPGLSDSSEEIHQIQLSQTQHPREEGVSQTSDSDEDDEDDEDNTGDDETIDHEPVINCSGDLIIEMPPLVEVPLAPSAAIDVPQFYSYNDTQPSFATLSMWPMYDRIYVGSAITTQAQLSAILRLLKVGGFMIAPVNDRFMKIRRTEKNKTSACSLLSVSFASLIPPGKNATKIDPLPERSVERLERLASRAIRCILRRIINARRGGPPVLGRHVEVSDDEEGEDAEETAASAETPVKAVHANGDALRPTDKEPTRIEEVDHHKAADEVEMALNLENRRSTTQGSATPSSSDSASSSLGSQASNTNKREPEFDAREPSPSKKRCEEESRPPPPPPPPPEGFGPQASPVSNGDPPTQEEAQAHGQEEEEEAEGGWRRTTRSRIYSPYVVLLASILNPRTRVINLRQLEQLREPEGGSEEEDNEGNTSAHRNRDSEVHSSQSGEQSEQEHEGHAAAAGDEDEEETEGRRGRRKKTKFEWVPQSYTYRDEMLRLLQKELDVPEFLAQRIMTVI